MLDFEYIDGNEIEAVESEEELLLVKNDDKAQDIDEQKRAARLLLALVGTMISSQLLILGLSLLYPLESTPRIQTLTVLQPGMLAIKPTNNDIDYLFIFFHPIPALITATQSNWFEAFLKRIFEARNRLGTAVFDLACNISASEPVRKLRNILGLD